MGGAGDPCCWPGSNRLSGRAGDPHRQPAMKGCLGALVVLTLLAWPIKELGQLFGWSDAQTGWVLLVVLGLLAIGASPHGRADPRRGGR